VLLGPNFVTVTAKPDAPWTALSDQIIPIVQAFVASGEAAVSAKAKPRAPAPTPSKPGSSA